MYNIMQRAYPVMATEEIHFEILTVLLSIFFCAAISLKTTKIVAVQSLSWRSPTNI